MLFCSIGFLFRFLPVFMIIYLISPAKYRNVVLLLGSLLFYGAGEPFFVLLLILSILFNYLISGVYYKLPGTEKKSARRAALLCALLVDFGVLFLFKYWDFAAENINLLTGRQNVPLLSLALPLGISFYTFQMASYQIDCYQRKIKTKPGMVEFAAYVCMFPQLIAGPIVKYEEVAVQLEERKLTAGGLERGLKLFTIGLGCKVLLANQIGTLWNTIMTAGAGNLSVPVAWLGAFAYSFQIYFDFWGYSLMAVGLGRMLGFAIPRNFRNPYAAKSISEFWRRWHITLGRWFREYVYIPMGGNRKGRVRTVINLCVVWSLTGLWHGANWNFVIWGLVFFVLLSLEKCGLGKWLEKTKVVGHLYVIALIPMTWIIFAITDRGQLFSYLQNMVGIHSQNAIAGLPQLRRYLQEYWWLLAVCALCATPLPARWYKKWKNSFVTILFLLAIFWFSVHEILVGANNPFLYFRF